MRFNSSWLVVNKRRQTSLVPNECHSHNVMIQNDPKHCQLQNFPTSRSRMVSCQTSQYCAFEHYQGEERYLCFLQTISPGSKLRHIIIHSTMRFACLKCANEQSGNEGCNEVINYHITWCTELDEPKVPKVETYGAFLKQLQKGSRGNIISWPALQKKVKRNETRETHCVSCNVCEKRQ